MTNEEILKQQKIIKYIPYFIKAMDAARKDEGSKLLGALEELVKWCEPDDRWNYMAALENAQKLINEYKNNQ